MVQRPPRSTLFPYTRSSDLSATLVALAFNGATTTTPRCVAVSRSMLSSPTPRRPTAIKFFAARSEEHTSELQSHSDLVCRLLLEKKNPIRHFTTPQGQKAAQ